eukprot:13536888-Ditylum_brightwellii.AAC.1
MKGMCPDQVGVDSGFVEFDAANCLALILADMLEDTVHMVHQYCNGAVGELKCFVYLQPGVFKHG